MSLDLAFVLNLSKNSQDQVLPCHKARKTFSVCTFKCYFPKVDNVFRTPNLSCKSSLNLR